MKSKLLLITPPFTQLNTPYPATAYLKGFLNTKAIPSIQVDLGIEVILKIFSKEGLKDIFSKAEINENSSQNIQRIYALREAYINTIDETVRFLQGKVQTFARQICTENYLPQAGRFNKENDLEWAFGNMGEQDKAKHLATLYLEDISDFIKECIDPNFGFSRYAEQLGRSANAFDELYEAINSKLSYIDEITLKALDDKVRNETLELICFSIPFPGNLYSAFKCAQYLKRHHPKIKIAMGGGFANTELRSVSDIRVFEFFDFISLDDGELPIELLLDHVLNNTEEFKRTFILEKGEVKYVNNSKRADYKQIDLGTPDYAGLPLDKYISIIEIANPMHSLWSDGRWNKLTMAHGCYWGKCTFCDISLDYIKLYEPIAANILVDRMENLIAQTGETGFHFVDEAAPPALMRALALEILKRGLTLTWWTNIRFEKSFTPSLCMLLKASGCIAVSGGLEVASDRLLKLIDKGVSVSQVAQVNRNFTEAGIMIHSYLMYGYPTQTVQETVDSLEMVRQMFELGIMQSGFWHQFALTAHSPVGLNPEKFGIIPELKKITFANNDVQFEDSTGIEHEQFSFGLKKSLFNYMHGICFDYPLQEWFDFEIPETSVEPDFIINALEEDNFQYDKSTARLLWLGTLPIIKELKGKKTTLSFHTKTNSFSLKFGLNEAKWLINVLADSLPDKSKPLTISEIKADYESRFGDFEPFWYSKPIYTLKENGLLIL